MLYTTHFTPLLISNSLYYLFCFPFPHRGVGPLRRRHRRPGGRSGTCGLRPRLRQKHPPAFAPCPRWCVRQGERGTGGGGGTGSVGAWLGEQSWQQDERQWTEPINRVVTATQTRLSRSVVAGLSFFNLVTWPHPFKARLGSQGKKKVF